jgi:hypothetical protein
MNDSAKKEFRHKPIIDSIILILGFLLAFYKFIYEGYMIPLRLPPYLTSINEINLLNQDANNYYVEVKIRIENQSKQRVNIANLCFF